MEVNGHDVYSGFVKIIKPEYGNDYFISRIQMKMQ